MNTSRFPWLSTTNQKWISLDLALQSHTHVDIAASIEDSAEMIVEIAKRKRSQESQRAKSKAEDGRDDGLKECCKME